MFDYSGQEQVIKNELIIERLSDSVEVYKKEQISFQFKHTIKENSLQNGTKYRAKIRVGGNNGEWSEYSDFVIFVTLGNPVVNFEPIVGNVIRNQIYEFSASYTHPNNEVLQSYSYSLFDSNGSLIKAYPTVFSDGTTPLTQQMDIFENDKSYQVQIALTTVNGQVFVSNKIQFLVQFFTASLNTLIEPKNVCSEGAVKLDIIVKRILLKLYNNDGNVIKNELVEYVDEDKIDLNRPDYSKLVVDDGIKVKSNNYIFQIWFENLPVDEILFKIYSQTGWLECLYTKGQFHCYLKSYNHNLVSHFVSNEINTENQQVTLWIRSISGSIDMKAEVI